MTYNALRSVLGLRRRRLLVVLATALVAAALAVGGSAQPASARPRPPAPITVPGGLTPGEQPQAGCASDGVCIVKDTSSAPSCTGYSSQTTPPTTIKVLVHGTTDTIATVDFRTYVQNVLPDEWIPSWDGEALEAGAVAVKSYAWYWVTHFGGYYRTRANCFDVTDDTNFQVYRAGSATTRTTDAVNQSWPVAARAGGRILQAFYRATLTGNTTEACGAGANGTTMSQWGSQNCVEANTGNKYNVILATYYSGVQLATTRQLRALDDFSFEQSSTPAFFSAGTWAIDDGYSTTFRFGVPGDVPTVWNAGDGFARIGVFRPSTGAWYRATPTGSIVSKLYYGQRGDIPVQAHYDGLGAPSNYALFRPSTAQWFVRGHSSVTYGANGDVPVPGDYTGDGKADVAVWRPSNGAWYVRGVAKTYWGQRGDIPLPADYNGDGKIDIAIYRPSGNLFYVRGRASVHWGQPGDVPVTGDFNGDGLADLAIYRPSTHQWWVRGQSTVTFGSAACTPIGKAPAHN